MPPRAPPSIHHPQRHDRVRSQSLVAKAHHLARGIKTTIRITRGTSMQSRLFPIQPGSTQGAPSPMMSQTRMHHSQYRNPADGAHEADSTGTGRSSSPRAGASAARQYLHAGMGAQEVDAGRVVPQAPASGIPVYEMGEGR